MARCRARDGTKVEPIWWAYKARAMALVNAWPGPGRPASTDSLPPRPNGLPPKRRPRRGCCLPASRHRAAAGSAAAGHKRCLPLASRAGSRQVVGWSMQARRGDGEDLAARFRDADGVLELSGELAVAGHRRPTVGQDFDVRFAQVDHRFDREQHPGFEHDAIARFAVVQDVRPIVKHASEAVTAEIADNPAALAFRVALDGGADMAGGVTGLHRRHTPHQGLVGHIDQSLGSPRDMPDGVPAAGLAVPAIEDQGDIDIDAIAFL